MGVEASTRDELEQSMASPEVARIAATLADIRERLARCERELAGVLGNLAGLAARLSDAPEHGCACGCS